MAELSIFIDESGSDGLKDRYYLLALVLHEQGRSISDSLARYEASLRERGLPVIPLHTSPLLNGHGDYEGMELGLRKRLLSAFRVFFRSLPVRYTCFALRTSEHRTAEELSAAMRRRIAEFLFDELEYLQSFDSVKVYYDNGQQSIAEAVHKAVDFALSRNAVVYRMASPADYALGQAADYACTLELAAIKYERGEASATMEKFFGSHRQFKKGPLKELRAKRA